MVESSKKGFSKLEADRQVGNILDSRSKKQTQDIIEAIKLKMAEKKLGKTKENFIKAISEISDGQSDKFDVNTLNSVKSYFDTLRGNYSKEIDKHYQKILEIVKEKVSEQMETEEILESTQEESKTETQFGTIRTKGTSEIQDERVLRLIKEIVQSAFQETLQKSIEGQTIAREPEFKSQFPDISNQIVIGKLPQLSSSDLFKIEKLLYKMGNSTDSNKKQKVQLFALELEKRIKKIKKGAQYESDEEFYQKANGIPLQQSKNLKQDTRPSLNKSVAVNASGFTIQPAPQIPPQAYDMISGKVILQPDEYETQKKYGTAEDYEKQKQVFMKEAFYTIRNLPPEQKIKAERILKGLEHYYKISHTAKKLEEELQKPLEEQQIDGKTKEDRLREIFDKLEEKQQIKSSFKKFKVMTEDKKLKELIGEKAYDFLMKYKQQQLEAKKHLEQQQQVNPGGIIIHATEEEQKERAELGQNKTRDEIIQDNVRVNVFHDGINQKELTTTDIQDLRDPGSVYNQAQPDFGMLKPFLEKILEQSGSQDQITSQQLQLAKQVLDQAGKDDLFLIQQINFLRSKFADVPLTSKEQQKVRNESEEIIRTLGQSQMYYPYNKKTIEALQTQQTMYYNEKGQKILAPFESVSKAQLEKKQKQMLDENKVESGKIDLQDIVKFVHQLAKYTGKIEGDIDLSKLDLPQYKQKTTIFTPQIKKVEDSKFNFTAESAFRLRQC